MRVPMNSGNGEARNSAQISTTELEFSGGSFTLGGRSVAVRLRKNGTVRVGCHVATKAAIKEIARLSEIAESVEDW